MGSVCISEQLLGPWFALSDSDFFFSAVAEIPRQPPPSPLPSFDLYHQTGV